MKKTITAAVSGALAGALITGTVFTFGVVKTPGLNTEKKDDLQNMPVTTVADRSYSEETLDFEYMAEEGKEVLSVEEIAKRVGPSIVGISCVTVAESFFGMTESESLGSGIIIDKNGHIVTNYHVIQGAKTIKVNLTSGSEYEATVVGGDEKTDVAIIKITANEELHIATIGDSDSVEVGSLAVAIGNPLANELFGTVTAGVISGVNRTITVGQREMNLIQTDAAISPGNSGGALINKYGEVIGINSVKLIDNAAEGLGFAIPMNEAVPIMKDLMLYGYVKGRPMIGVSVREITPELAYYNNLLVDYGLYIMSVTEGSGAEKAGLTRGDIIIKVEGQKVTSSTQMNKIRDTHKAGEKLNLVVVRAGREVNVSVTLTEDLTGKK